jgi:membrane protease YdiL (CAAX protease family)
MPIYVIGVIVTLIAGVESLPMYPLSPFIFIHALFAVVIPLSHPYSQVRLYFKNGFLGFKKFIFKGLLWGIVYVSLFSIIIGYMLKVFHLDRDAFWNVLLLYRQTYQSLEFSLGTPVIDISLFIFIVLWAGIAEELFYRGFVFGGLRQKYSFAVSLVASSALFGLRHSLQLLYFLPGYPLLAGIIYFLFSFGAGCLLAYLLEDSKSLLTIMAVHSGINSLGFPILLYIFKTKG